MLTDDVLTQFDPLNLLERQFLTEVAKKAQIVTANKGTLIFKRGRELTELFFLLEGEVNLINNEFGVEKVEPYTERSKQALNLSVPTQESAIAKTSVRYFKLAAEDVKRLITLSQAPVGSAEKGDDQVEGGNLSDDDDWMSCLLKSPLFTRVPLPQLQDLFKTFETVPVKRNEKIIKEGAKGDYFHVLAAGTALVTNFLGTVDIELKPGHYFGEEALVSDAPRNATVTMTSDGVLKRLSADDFLTLLKEPVLRYIEGRELAKFDQPYKLLDVKMPVEHRVQHLPGSINVPLSRLRRSLPELAQTNLYVVTDDAGKRADIAAYLLCQAGFDAVILKNSQAEMELKLA